MMGTNTLQSRQYQEKIEQSQPTFPLSRLNLEKKNRKMTKMVTFIYWCQGQCLLLTDFMALFHFWRTQAKSNQEHCFSFTTSPSTPFWLKRRSSKLDISWHNWQDPWIHIWIINISFSNSIRSLCCKACPGTLNALFNLRK